MQDVSDNRDLSVKKNIVWCRRRMPLHGIKNAEDRQKT